VLLGASLLALLCWQSGAVIYLSSRVVAWFVRGGELQSTPVNELPQLQTLERAFDTIVEELKTIHVAALSPFERIDPAQVRLARFGGIGWSVFLFVAFGVWIESTCRLCPKTAAALRSTPGVSSAMFSVMQPGKVIPPHRGPFRGVLRYHLALVVPSDGECFIEIEGRRHYWREASGVVFDDTRTHRAVNATSAPRVVLFVDIIRPNMSTIPRVVTKATLWLMKYSARVRVACARAAIGDSATFIER
jgi:aspartyl/asparaginyl beta-hydroxylase (cupin superfamily)